MITPLSPNPKYEIKPGVVGLIVKYDCLGCGVRLRSSLQEAGNVDHCPDCGTQLVVPAAAERIAERERLESEQLQREAKSKTAKLRRPQSPHNASRPTKKVRLERDPLREWLLYIVVIGALLSIAAGRYLVIAIQSDHSGLCTVIIGLFAVGVILNFAAVRQLRIEFANAADTLQHLRSRGDSRSIACIKATGILYQHIHDLVQVAKHEPNVSQEGLIAMVFSKQMAKSKIVDLLSGILVSLGLIGTVVGLIAMTHGLSSTLDSMDATADASALMTGLRETMSGLGTAFYTTLVGAILGSVVLRVLNHVYTTNVEHFVTYITSLTEVEIIPRLRYQARTAEVEVQQ